MVLKNKNGYKETKVLLQAINTNSNKLDMDISVKKVTTVSSSLLTDNIYGGILNEDLIEPLNEDEYIFLNELLEKIEG